MIVLFLSACSERFTAYYPKYEDALKAGAVKCGWIPEIIPKMAIDIHEQHDIDTTLFYFGMTPVHYFFTRGFRRVDRGAET